MEKVEKRLLGGKSEITEGRYMKGIKRNLFILFFAVTIFVSFTAFSVSASAGTLLRVYNPNSGEHHYTENVNERNHLVKVGWRNEGTAWETPSNGADVYRLYNPNNGGDHHYTTNASERDAVIRAGWRYEGKAWKSGGSTPVYRLYNPNAKTGTHHYTLHAYEKNNLVKAGWRYEGIAFYSGKDTPTPPKPVDVKPVEALGNSGILEKTLKAAFDKANVMHSDPNSKYFVGKPVNNDQNYVWAFKTKTVKMSDGSTWYSVEFYADRLG